MLARTERAPSGPVGETLQGRAPRRAVLAAAALLLAACGRPAGPETAGGGAPVPKMDPRTAALVEKAVALHESGRIGDAIGTLEEAVRIDPDSAGAWSKLAALALQRQDERRAREAALEALRRDPEAALAHGVIGALGIRQGDFGEAVEHLQKVARLRPSPNDLEALGRAHAGLGRTAEAAQVFAEALRLDPRHAGALNGLGLIELREGRLDAARRRFEAVLAIDPDDDRALFNLGNVLVRQGEHARGRAALAAFERRRKVLAEVDLRESAARAQPLSPDVHCDLAEAYLRAGRLEAVIRSLLRALEIDPAHRRSLRGIARLGIEHGNTGPALEILEAGLARSPGDPEITALIAEVRRAGASPRAGERP